MAMFAWPYLKGAQRVLIVAPASHHAGLDTSTNVLLAVIIWILHCIFHS
jgi:hypothetical protein